MDVDKWSKDRNEQPKSLHIVHMNVCSLRKHFNELLVLLQDCLLNLDVICLTEVNIQEDEVSLYKLDGFNTYTYTREKQRGGGIVIYIREEIKFERKIVCTTQCESIYGRISLDELTLELLVVYRPPDTNKILFMSEIEQIIKKIPTRSDVIVLGDININILDEAMDGTKARYLNMCAGLGLYCAIRDVTREAVVRGRRTVSCIDHLFVRNGAKSGASALHAYTLRRRVADHYMTGLSIDISKPVSRACTQSFYNHKTIERELNDIEWANMLNVSDPIQLYNQVKNIFDTVYELSAYNVICSKKRCTQPWITKDLQIMINKKDLLFRQWKSNPNNNNLRLLYTKFRNMTQKFINRAKNNYKKQVIKNCNGDMRKIWKNINSWLGKSNLSIDSVIEKYMLKSNNRSLVNICNNFCDTFTGEVEVIKLSHKCNKELLNRQDYVKECNVSFRFKKITPIDVLKVINNMNCNKSPGSDGIRVQELKLIKDKICSVISHFVNLCVSKGVYPDELKKAIIRPIYKQGQHSEYTNYRPIAILNTLNKITEKLIMGQITSFLENNNILSDIQHGFRPNRSTDTALSQFTDDINKMLNEQKVIIALFIDYKKAFDTLDHVGLLRAMNECGIRGPMSIFFQNYLQNRTLKVKVRTVESKEGYIKYGVPTGSVFGPLGYIMHVNSMANVVNNCNIYMYADDTCLLYGGKDMKVISKAIQDDFDNIVRWAHDNGLIININKTKCMLISSPYNKNKTQNVIITGHSYDCLHKNKIDCTCNKLEQVTSYKYLGLTIDRSFSWNTHVETVCNKLRSILGKFYNIRHCVSRGILFMLYHALTESTVGYGLAAYGLTFPSYLTKIKTIQKRTLKLLVDQETKCSLNKDYDKLFKICEVLPIELKVRTLIILEKYNTSNTGTNLLDGCKQRVYPTRAASKNKLVMPRSSNYYGKRTRQWLVPRLLNDLPQDFIKKATSKVHLKKLLKRYYLSECP